MMGMLPLERAAPRTKSSWLPTPLYKLRADRVGAHLAGQVDRQGRVDADHLVVARAMLNGSLT